MATRAHVSAYLRRFDGWTALVTAIAAELGVATGDVIAESAPGDPVAFLEARTQRGDFAIAMRVFIDSERAPGFHGTDAFLIGLAKRLACEVLYDDGRSDTPTRWVLVRPVGGRFEVFEDADAGAAELVLDPSTPPRLLGSPS